MTNMQEKICRVSVPVRIYNSLFKLLEKVVLLFMLELLHPRCKELWGGCEQYDCWKAFVCSWVCTIHLLRFFFFNVFWERSTTSGLVLRLGLLLCGVVAPWSMCHNSKYYRMLSLQIHVSIIGIFCYGHSILYPVQRIKNYWISKKNLKNILQQI